MQQNLAEYCERSNDPMIRFMINGSDLTIHSPITRLIIVTDLL